MYLFGVNPGDTVPNAELSLAGVLGVLKHPRNSGTKLTLFQPEGADYAYHITASTPGFENLTTSLKCNYKRILNLHINFYRLHCKKNSGNLRKQV